MRRFSILALLAIAGITSCGDVDSPSEPPKPKLRIERVELVDLACSVRCGFRLTYEARTVDTGAPAATTLRLEGDGWHPDRVQTTLPTGRVTFFWEYPRPTVSGTRYNLTICPPSGDCVAVSATISFPDGS